MKEFSIKHKNLRMGGAKKKGDTPAPLCGARCSGENKIPRVGKKTKRYSSVEKRDYVLSHVGIQSVKEMAVHLGCTPLWVYEILRKVRSERELLHGKLVETVAEEQFNRLNQMARDAFLALDSYRKAHPEGDQIYRLHKIYRDAEHSLTYFLRAVGMYRDDRPVMATQINVNIGKRGINEVLEEIRGDYDGDIVDVIAKNIEQQY